MVLITAALVITSIILTVYFIFNIYAIVMEERTSRKKSEDRKNLYDAMIESYKFCGNHGKEYLDGWNDALSKVSDLLSKKD